MEGPQPCRGLPYLRPFHYSLLSFSWSHRASMQSTVLLQLSLTIWLSLASAQQDFVALNNYGGYSALENCQKTCLHDDRAAGSYENLDNAKKRCRDLGTQLDDVNTCMTNNVVPVCRTNSTALFAAQSILAGYRTTVIGLQYNVPIPVTTPGNQGKPHARQLRLSTLSLCSKSLSIG